MLVAVLSFVLLQLVLCRSQLESFVRANHTVSHGFASYSELKGPDREMLQSLLPLVDPNHGFRHCSRNMAAMQSLQGLDSSYVDGLLAMKLLHGGFGIVSKPRKRCTALLTKAALTLPDGDIVETGTFIGTSAAIIMKVLMDFDSCERKLWVFDSFEGLPAPTEEDGAQGSAGGFAATLETFEDNLRSVDAYDEDKLVITKGWFAEVCGPSKVSKIAFLRLDGDLFASTWDAIVALYDRVIPGGFVYVDDYGSFVGCRKAIDKFRAQLGIFEPLHYVRENDAGSRSIVFEAVWWMKRAHK